MLIDIVEHQASRPKEIDSRGHLLRGVKLVGLESPKKGRRYSPEALKRAVPKYLGAKVNVNHQTEPGKDRSLADRIGRVEKVEFIENKGLYGDVRLNPNHPLTSQILWWSLNDPAGIGFSHAVQGRGSVQGGTQLIEEIVDVHSVDLVADPATTKGLFESEGADEMATEESDDVGRLSRIYAGTEGELNESQIASAWRDGDGGTVLQEAEDAYAEGRADRPETDVRRLERLWR